MATGVPNPGQVIIDGTTTANVCVKLPGITGLKHCAWLAIRNNSDTEIRIKTKADATTKAFEDTAANAIPLAPGEYKIVGAGNPNSPNAYNLDEYGIFCTASAKSFTLEYLVV